MSSTTAPANLLTAEPIATPLGAPITMFGPDFPFAYDDWLRHPAGLGALPPEALGTRVAVVGGGIAGVVAAYELMRLGLHPVLYEAEQLGGRMRSTPFPNHPDSVAEMGAMRFPTAATTLFHYIDTLRLATRPFPNPFAPGTPSTVVDLKGLRHQGRTADDLPPLYRQVADAWRKTLQETADLPAMDDLVRRRDVAGIKAIWNRLVPQLDDRSFYNLLSGSSAFGSFRHREVFGQVGFGSGGWDTDFPNSALEVLRVVYSGADADHQRILGGCQRLPLGLWAHPAEDPVHWPAGTSLAGLHPGGPRPAVTALRRDGERIAVVDSDGVREEFPAVVFTAQLPVLLARVDCDESLLPDATWTAVEHTHYMGASKVFALADRPFWRDRDPRTGQHVMSMTLTDRLPRGVYLFDDGPDRPGVMCLSYTWNDDSLKFATLTARERMDLVLSSLHRIYPDLDFRSHIIDEPVAITWETEPNFMGAFKQNLPGHYRYQRRLFTHFEQSEFARRHRGLFLAGDDVSWTGGFAEGAVTTALNTVWGVLNHLGGHTHPGNPGPGDRFAELAPLRLPDDPPAGS